MITHVAITGFAVGDQESALAFWVDKVRFEKRSDHPYGEGTRWLEVAPPGALTRVVLSPASEHVPVRVSPVPVMGFETADLRATYEALAARGMEFVEPPTAQPWGTQAVFRDPDGHLFVLVEP
ncbi:MAG: VOC family protein [Chloroflexota bacterium]|nr:VOC family protein [Chloroflexota bacterium]